MKKQKNITKQKSKVSHGKKNKKIPAVFLDRDGTLIDSPHLNWKKEQFKISKGVAEQVKKINAIGVPVIVVTNQPVVARGLLSEEGVISLHNMLAERMMKKGATIDKFYFCPHHPNANVEKYRIVCRCRKPKIGLFLEARKDFNIDLEKSFVIGDMTQDIFAGKKIKATTILVKQGYGGTDGKFLVDSEILANTTEEALKIIVKTLAPQGFYKKE
jgi:D-glycero-D-manno-heptose 1,7-bisphosphate phosphatase